MIGFGNHLLRATPDKKKQGSWVLLDPLFYWVDRCDWEREGGKQWPFIGKAGVRVEVPAGFSTNLLSSPRFFLPIFPRHHSYSAAAVIHDYLYATKKYSREFSDVVFLLAMRDLGVRRLTAWMLFRGVRLGGWWPWKFKEYPEYRTN